VPQAVDAKELKYAEQPQPQQQQQQQQRNDKRPSDKGKKDAAGDDLWSKLNHLKELEAKGLISLSPPACFGSQKSV